MQYIRRQLAQLWKTIGKANLYRNITRVFWLFFPAILFSLLSYYAFWKLSQGKDLMLYTLEDKRVFFFFIIAQVFWTYTTWLSSRLVAKAKYWEEPDYLWLRVRVHVPRFLAYNCFSIIIFAFVQVPGYEKIEPIPPAVANAWWWLSLPLYLVLNRMWKYFIYDKNYTVKSMLIAATVVVIPSMLAIMLWPGQRIWMGGLLLLLLELQACLVLVMVARRKRIELQMPLVYVQQSSSSYNYDEATGIRLLLRKIKRLLTDPEDRTNIRVFNIISSIALAVYISSIFNVHVAVYIGAFPFVLLAFGVLTGFVNLIATASVFSRFNFHLIFFIIGFTWGAITEPHYVQLEKKAEWPADVFAQRQNLKEYFNTWLQQRDSLFTNDTLYKNNAPIPLYFVMANGGASRSGYWTASVLGELQDKAGNRFSDHLFCLSGASGGSLGNATFFALLMNRDSLPRSDTAYRDAASDYLRSDFLAFTLARMLGPDFFRYIIPSRIKDRSWALVHSLEHAPRRQDVFLYDKLSRNFSAFMTRKNRPDYKLPVLCINTTRMQEGKPGIISNILIDSVFNGRIDVLRLLDGAQKDMKLSTGVVLGASFPYLSPAGRIDKAWKRDSVEANYFVDGGYFDNSGAGAVNEMLIAMNRMMKDTANVLIRKYAPRLRFYVIHITNDPVNNEMLQKVNPIVNDLAAPVQTLLGSYGTQTTVNDMRLKKFVEDLYPSDVSHYYMINLYKPKESMVYSMNWVISRRTLDSMDARLRTHPELRLLEKQIRQAFREK